MSSSAPITLLRRAFVDITRGYSIGVYKGAPLYVRHLSHFSHQDFDDIQLRFEEEAKREGAPDEAERLSHLRAKGQWSDAKEAEIARQREVITSIEDGKRSVAVPSMIVHYEQQIAREKEILGKLLTERAELIRFTTEIYAQRKVNDHYILANLFRDKGLSEPLIVMSQLEDMEDSEVESIHECYQRAIEPCGDSNLRRLAVADFYTSYFNLCENNLQSFYGRPVCELTYYQVRLGNISRYFRSLLEQTDLSKVPAGVRGDPEAIERLHITQKNMQAMAADGKVPTNMSASDLEAAGMKHKMTQLPAKDNISGAELVKHLRAQHGRGSA